jgi:hypothetical protein
MPPSNQGSLGLQRLVNASYRGPGPPILSGYVPKFLPFLRIPVTSVLGLTKALEGRQSESMVCHGLPVGARRRCEGGPRALFYRGSPFEEPVRGNLADDRGVTAAAGRGLPCRRWKHGAVYRACAAILRMPVSLLALTFISNSWAASYQPKNKDMRRTRLRRGCNPALCGIAGRPASNALL